MKKLYTLLLSSLLISNIFATDRYVTGTGFGGTYTSIMDAIAASSNGDRILVYPKTGGNYYFENPTIALSNVQLLSAVEGQRFKVWGTIVLGAGCYLVGAEVGGGNIIDVGGSYSNVHIVNCVLSGGSIYSSGVDAKTWVDNDIVLNGSIMIYKGRVSGCQVVGTQYSGCIQVLSGAAASNDTVLIVGNSVDAYGAWGESGCAINIQTSNVFSYTANNYMKVSGSESQSIPSTGLKIANGKADPIIRNVVVNNTVCVSYPSTNVSPYDFRQSNSVVVLMDIHNNVSTSSGAGGAPIGFNRGGMGTAGMTFKYNYDHNSTTAFGGMPSDPSNISSSTTTVDLITGALNSGSDAINGGDPGTAYLDLDLSRNDAGCYGGSYSRENFTQPETGSLVLFMKAPREVLQGMPVNISGEGVDK